MQHTGELPPVTRNRNQTVKHKSLAYSVLFLLGGGGTTLTGSVTAAGFQPSVELLHPPQLSEFMKKSFKSVRSAKECPSVAVRELKGIRLHIHTKWHKHFFQLLDLTRVQALRTIRRETFPLLCRSEQCLNCN